MKSTFIAAIAAFMVMTGCQDHENLPQSATRQEMLIADFKGSDVYSDFERWNLRLNIDASELVEITHFEYLFIPAKEASGNELTYVVKWVPSSGWEHFLNIDQEGESREDKQFSGIISFDFYTEGARSIHTFSNGIQTDYQVYIQNVDTKRRSILGRSSNTEECESMCHVLDCAGRKFEDKHWLSQVECASNMMPCLASLAIQCLDEGCANSWVKSCDYH